MGEHHGGSGAVAADVAAPPGAVGVVGEGQRSAHGVELRRVGEVEAERQAGAQALIRSDELQDRFGQDVTADDVYADCQMCRYVPEWSHPRGRCITSPGSRTRSMTDSSSRARAATVSLWCAHGCDRSGSTWTGL
ncbi:hypothetical protein GCM10009772_27740 [Pseudonocardia alni subsp. carboxydivorans]